MYEENLMELIGRSNRRSYPILFLVDRDATSRISGERAVYVFSNTRHVEFPSSALREALEESLANIKARVPTHGYIDEGIIPLDVIVDNSNRIPIRVRVPRRYRD